MQVYHRTLISASVFSLAAAVEKRRRLGRGSSTGAARRTHGREAEGSPQPPLSSFPPLHLPDNVGRAASGGLAADPSLVRRRSKLTPAWPGRSARHWTPLWPGRNPLDVFLIALLKSDPELNRAARHGRSSRGSARGRLAFFFKGGRQPDLVVFFLQPSPSPSALCPSPSPRSTSERPFPTSRSSALSLSQMTRRAARSTLSTSSPSAPPASEGASSSPAEKTSFLTKLYECVFSCLLLARPPAQR